MVNIINVTACRVLKDASELKDYLDSMYCAAAQYDSPPRYPVNEVCKGIDGGAEGTDILGRIFSGIVAMRGNKSCYDLGEFFSDETLNGWDWQAIKLIYIYLTFFSFEFANSSSNFFCVFLIQTCSELVIPMGRGENDTMFPAAPFDLKQYMDSCQKYYGVLPRPHWITTYYGGHVSLNLYLPN